MVGYLLQQVLVMIARRLFFFQLRTVTALIFAFLSTLATTNAIILFRTGDPTANTTAPTGNLAGSGWQYEGLFGSFLGTAIAPHFFITARHVGVQSNTFLYRGVNYTILQSFDDPTNSDLRIYQVAEQFPDYAPLYSKRNEIGQHLVVFGRGTQRGNDVFADGILRGWEWGGSDAVERWGENQVDDIVSFGSLGDMLYALFDGNGFPEEAHLSSGDSGGGIFISDNGVWKLAALNYSVDGPFSTSPGGDGFLAALFDMRGLYGINGILVAGPAPVPSGFYASRISSKLAWIQSIIGPGLVNISARAQVGNGDQVCIAGLIIQGSATKTKRILVRGMGPSLQVGSPPFAGRLMDPMIELHNSAGATILINDDWRSSQQAEILSTGFAPSNNKEAALIAVLSPGSYTVILRGVGGTTGIGLIEIYDLDGSLDPDLGNLSARADVETGDGILIGGLIVRSTSKPVLLRALGPELTNNGIVDVLEDPTMELRDSNGVLLVSNDNWRDASNSAAIQATRFAPNDDRESAILTTPAPGNYTALVRGAGNTTGTALLEVYLMAH
jgi:hypothetical protein